MYKLIALVREFWNRQSSTSFFIGLYVGTFLMLVASVARDNNRLRARPAPPIYPDEPAVTMPAQPIVPNSAQ